MSIRWEQSIEDWYQKSHTGNLEYLDLAEVPKPTTRQLAHNISVLFDRISLSSRVQIRNQKLIQEHLILYIQKQEKLEKDIEELKTSITKISERKPLTKENVFSLVAKISEQPKLIEQQTEALLIEVSKRIEQLEHMIKKVEQNILG